MLTQGHTSPEVSAEEMRWPGERKDRGRDGGEKMSPSGIWKKKQKTKHNQYQDQSSDKTSRYRATFLLLVLRNTVTTRPPMNSMY